MKLSLIYFKAFMVLAIIYCLPSHGYSQNEPGTLRAFINPKDARLKINDVEKDISGATNSGALEVELAPGKYVLEIWHPFFKLHTDTVTIRSKESNLYRHTFREQNQAYIDLRLALRKPKVRQVYTIIGAGLVNIAGWIPIVRYDKTLETSRIAAIEQLRLDYNLSTDREEISRLQESFARSSDELVEMQENRNIKRAIGIPLMIGANALITYFYIKNKKDFKKIEQSFKAPPPFTLRTEVNDGMTVSLALKF